MACPEHDPYSQVQLLVSHGCRAAALDPKHVYLVKRRSLSGPRVLLADDHSFLLRAVSALLSDSCKVVATVSDGAALVTEALRLNPDVIVTDIAMPIMNGIDAIRQIKEAGSKARFVFLTVHTEEEFVKTCLAEGALGYVHKSRMKAHLGPAIQEVLDGRSYISLPKTS